MKSGSGIPGV